MPGGAECEMLLRQTTRIIITLVLNNKRLNQLGTMLVCHYTHNNYPSYHDCCSEEFTDMQLGSHLADGVITQLNAIDFGCNIHLGQEHIWTFFC